MRTEAVSRMSCQSRPLSITAVSAFFVFSALMSGLSAVMLQFPGTLFDPLWRLNPRAHEGFAAMGPVAVLLMAAVCLACAVASLGLWTCKRWGFWTALFILSVNLAGDVTNSLLRHDWRTLIGLPIGGLMIAYLLRQRCVFTRRTPT